ncbi:sulfatase-like hydrolase/transferase [Klebsiella aerogenes]|uniref:sulfatase-like hydrolase/transferase n=1 Tax=Klebsiella aerogenes TaxID=548 RepID=UPI001D0CF850|nr:sulfatase-like hydrolase/transferase [Klebsiella aerogenes]
MIEVAEEFIETVRGRQKEDPTIANVLKQLGYATGQFGKNHLGDRDEFLPTAHGFDEFLGNLYHLNAEEEPENPDYPKDPNFRKQFGPRGDAVNVWRLVAHQTLIVGAQVQVADIIAKDNYDVRLFSILLRRCRVGCVSNGHCAGS